MEVPSTGEDTPAVRAFFDQWDIYKKVVDCNFLRHREAMSSVGKWLLDRNGEAGRFLDLGCGDAAFTSRMLSSAAVVSYTGVDCSPIALNLADQNLAGCSFPRTFVCGDFVAVAGEMDATFDVVFIGLSLHHLHAAGKQAFFATIRSRLAPGGALVIFEPAARENEGRQEALDRFVNLARARLPEYLNSHEIDEVCAHVSGHDYPESPQGFGELAGKGGFPRTKVLYKDPDDLIVVLACET